jgi:protein-tyrosine phosphatase
VDFVRARKAEERKVLVACGAGISRSVSFSIAALKEEEGLSLLDAYAAIRAVHPDALPHPALWESLRQYYGESTTYLMMVDTVLMGKKGDG